MLININRSGSLGPQPRRSAPGLLTHGCSPDKTSCVSLGREGDFAEVLLGGRSQVSKLTSGPPVGLQGTWIVFLGQVGINWGAASIDFLTVWLSSSRPAKLFKSTVVPCVVLRTFNPNTGRQSRVHFCAQGHQEGTELS